MHHAGALLLWCCMQHLNAADHHEPRFMTVPLLTLAFDL